MKKPKDIPPAGPVKVTKSDGTIEVLPAHDVVPEQVWFVGSRQPRKYVAPNVPERALRRIRKASEPFKPSVGPQVPHEPGDGWISSFRG